MSEQLIYQLRVNGKIREVRDAWVGESLLYVLRERLGLPGTKGACLVMAASAGDADIVTIEHLSEGGLTDVQEAFVSTGGVQCGFCTPGLIMAVHHLLEHTPDPSDEEIKESISGNLCRCTGYGRIFEAVRETIRTRGGNA